MRKYFPDTFHVVTNCCSTQIPKLDILMLLISLSHGLRNFGLLPSNHQKNVLLKTFLKPATGGNVFFVFLKLKMKRYSKKFGLLLFRSNTVLPIFGKLKIKFRIFFISNFLFGDYYLL